MTLRDGDPALLSPADDLPVHQVAQPVAVVGTSDRNFYDRYYFCAHHCSDELVVVAGLGQYPNLGVTDAFLAVTHGVRQDVLRASKEAGPDRLDLSVGPLQIDVVTGLKELRVLAGPNDSGIRAELHWKARSPAYLEPRHINRNGPRVTTESVRFCQTGVWSGTVTVDDRTWILADERWLGVRDRSWGIRPVGRPEPDERRFGSRPRGFLWLYGVIDFGPGTLVFIVQEDAAGTRSLEHAALVDADGKPTRDLGGVSHTLQFEPGSRRVARAQIGFGDGTIVELRPVGASHLALGTGYGTEAGWRHGMHQGPLAVERRTYDLAEPGVRRAAYGLVDSVAEATMDGQVGYGLFEYAVLGQNDAYGFSTRDPAESA